jgi:hypothetical protein
MEAAQSRARQTHTAACTFGDIARQHVVTTRSNPVGAMRTL